MRQKFAGPPSGEYAPTSKPNLFRHRTTGEALFFRTDAHGTKLLNHGSYPFVTAYRLETVDTQSFTTTAYWIFVLGLTGMGFLTLASAIKLARAGTRRAGAGYALLGVGLAASGIALYLFFGAAMAISENELQRTIPEAAHWYLSVPIFSSILIALFVIGWIARYARRTFPNVIALAGILLFGAFVIFLTHWHAFGWWFPETAAIT